MNLGDLLPVFAATDAAAASAERNGKFTEFPDEEPTVKQMNDWLEVNLPVITKSHHRASNRQKSLWLSLIHI